MCLCVLITDTRVFLTVAVDLVITGIQEPVRFLVETRAKIFPPSERFWYIHKKPQCELFMMKLKEVRFCFLQVIVSSCLVVFLLLNKRITYKIEV